MALGLEGPSRKRDREGRGCPEGPAPPAGPAHLGRPLLPRGGLGPEAAPRESKACGCAREGCAGRPQTLPRRRRLRPLPCPRARPEARCASPGAGRAPQRPASAHRKSALSTAAPCRRALTSPPTSDSEGRTGRKAGPRAVRHWTVNVGSGVTDRTGCRDIFNGTDFKAAGHPGKEGVVRPSDGEEKGG